MAHARRCDLFNVSGRGLVCGPALLIVGIAKCGTNAMATYMARLGNIYRTQHAEAVFDPLLIHPEEFVATHAPQAPIGPHDEGVWIAKHPTLAYESEKETFDYAKRLRAAFPSASVAICLCDPDPHPYRWFRHSVTHHLLCTKEGDNKISAETLEQETQQRFNLSLVEAYNVIESWGISQHKARCISPGSKTNVLPPPVWWLFHQEYFISRNCSNSSNSFSLAEYSFGERFRSWSENQDCNQSTTAGLKESSVGARFVNAFVAAGYKVNRSVAAVYMESWDLLGDAYLQMMQRVMHLPARNISVKFRPVYAASKGLLPELAHIHENIAWHDECFRLFKLLKQYPPWVRCDGLR